MTWDGIPERFHANRKRGRAMELEVALMLLDKGYAVQVQSRDEEAEEGMSPRDVARTFIDEKDIIVGRGQLEGDLVEVKSSSYAFTSDPLDWPFREVFVTSRGRWERYPMTPFAFVLISQQTGEMLTVFPDHLEEWYVKPVLNSTREHKSMEVVAAPLSHLRPIEHLLDVLDDR